MMCNKVDNKFTFGGFLSVSLVDYDKYVSSVVYVNDCNLDCPYCYNKKHLKDSIHRYRFDKVLKHLHKKYIDAVVISGGEPSMFPDDVIEFMRLVRLELPDKKIKLDTNGTNPDFIKYVIENKLVDYIAIDYKTNNYNKHFPGVNHETILKSIFILNSSSMNFEVRITANPDLLPLSDILDIEVDLYDVRNVFIQPLRIYSNNLNVRHDLNEFAERLHRLIPNSKLRR